MAQSGTAFFSFASVWLITKTVSSEGYGIIVAIIAASQLVQIFINWSSTALPRFGIEEFVETGKITKTFWTRSLMFFPNLLIVSLSAFFWLAPLATWLKIPNSAMFLIAVHILITSIWLHIQYALQGIKMLRLQGILLTVERALTFTLTISFIVFNKISSEYFLWCYVLPPIITSVVGISFLRPFIEFSNFYDPVQFRKMLVFSIPLVPFAVIGYLSTSQLDAVFINHFLSLKDLGVYSIATQINAVTLQLPILANSILLSMFVSLKATGNDSLVSEFFRQIVPTLTLIWGFLCMILAFTGVFFIPIIFGADFEMATISLWILLSSSVIAFPVLTGLATLSNTYSKTYISMYASIFAAITNVLFNMLLIPKLGMIGCAWATVTSSFTSLLIFHFFLKKEKLLSQSWVLMSVSPLTMSAIIVSFNQSIWLAMGICSLLTFFVAYLQKASIQKTLYLLYKRPV